MHDYFSSFPLQSPYFYEVGNKLNELWEKSPAFSDFLVRTFRARYYELISKVCVYW